jgi:hypothetical protein
VHHSYVDRRYGSFGDIDFGCGTAGQVPRRTAAAGRLTFGNQQPMPYNVWAAISRDGGGTFNEPLKISAADSPAGRPGAAGDDYSHIVLDRDYAYVGWPDWRPGERQGFFRAIPLSEFRPKR